MAAKCLDALVADKVRVNANLSLGWFSGDANVKIIAKDNRTATFKPVEREGMGTWKYTIEEAEASRDQQYRSKKNLELIF